MEAGRAYCGSRAEGEQEVGGVKSVTLPSELKSEVNDFVDFLLAKMKKQLKKKKSVFGCAKGEIIMSPDFDKPIEDFKDYI